MIATLVVAAVVLLNVTLGFVVRRKLAREGLRVEYDFWNKQGDDWLPWIVHGDLPHGYSFSVSARSQSAAIRYAREAQQRIQVVDV